MEKLYIIIPAYNEKDNIKQVINDWYPIVEKIGDESRIVIINDGSTDNTLNILKKEEKKRKQLIILNKENGGHGDTLIYGYKYAIKNKADYIFQTDSDGQTNPLEFEDFWNERKKYDAIIGNRIDRKDGNDRIFIEKILCFILKIIFHVNIPDSNAPFRLMNTKKVDDYIKFMPEHYNLPNVILTVCFKYFNESLLFIPISFKPRQAGKNSINIKKIIKIGVHAIKDFYNIKKKLKEVSDNEKND